MRILIMFSILLLFLIFYISKQLQHETYQGIHQTMDLYVQQLNKSMETAENCLWEFANNNTDVVDTITSKNNPNAVISQIKASRLLDNTLSYMTDIDGMFVYGKANDHFVCRYKNGGSNDCSSYMKKLLRQSGEDASALNFKSWYYIELERHTYLIRIINDLHNGSRCAVHCGGDRGTPHRQDQSPSAWIISFVSKRFCPGNGCCGWFPNGIFGWLRR